MVRIFILLAAVLVMGSCKDEEEAKGKWYEECEMSEDCEPDLVCASGLCNIHCTGNVDCQIKDQEAVCNNGYCFLPCDTDNDCDSPMTCHNMGGISTCTPASR